MARKSSLVIITNLFAALIARYMGPETLGIKKFGIGFTGLFLFLSNLGFDNTHIKRVPELCKSNDEWVQMNLTAKLGCYPNCRSWVQTLKPQNY